MPNVDSVEKLRKRLHSPRAQFLELWAVAPPDQSLCALINGDVGWLMYLRESGDAGFSTRNPNYTGDKDALIDYLLDNGQGDQYPAAWALPVSEIQRAIEHFLIHRQPASWLTWHNDSQDGVTLGHLDNK